MKPEKIIEECKIKTLLVFPFFGIILLKLPIIEDNTIDTFATDFHKIIYNKDYLLSLKKSEVGWALIHECLHVAYKHDQRRKDRDFKIWNMACDYAIHDIMRNYIDSVLSNEIETGKQRKLKISEILSTNEDWLYNPNFHNMSAEEIYERIKDSCENESTGLEISGQFDDHSKWDSSNNNYKKFDSGVEYIESDWDISITAALEKAKEKLVGNLPASLDRLLKSLINPNINWRDLLYDFIQFDINDYSFNPPDVRNQSECILPSFNEMEEETIKNILFFIDTSGSITDDILNTFYYEIVNILECFNYVVGYLGFFDYDAYAPERFETMEDILKIKPKGGGGTNFSAPFEWINNNFHDEIAAIIILTDGECKYPDEKITNGVPVLWLYSYEQDSPPPFGVSATIDD